MDTGKNSNELVIKHQQGANRFAVRLDNKIAYLSYNDNGGGILDYAHVFVPEAFRNRGIASKITKEALEYARENGFKIIPTCPFVEAYIRVHPEYKDVVT